MAMKINGQIVGGGSPPPDRSDLAAAYADGIGIEVGAFHNPWPVPPGSTVLYVDKSSKDALQKRFPEVADRPIVETQQIGNAETLEGIAARTFHFLCSSHVIEHMENPLLALENWLRVVKPGGHILLAIPEKNHSFDRDRENTTWGHIWREYVTPGLARDNRHSHFTEYLAHVDKLTGAELETRAQAGANSEDDIHFHCWDQHDISEMLTLFHDRCLHPYMIRHFSFQGHEVLAVLERL